MNHTTGPWYIKHETNAILIEGDENQPICAMWGGWGAREDARLIAAAPDLLAALELLAHGCTRPMGEDSCGQQYVHVRLAAIERARAAIAKATGGEQ